MSNIDEKNIEEIRDIYSAYQGFIQFCTDKESDNPFHDADMEKLAEALKEKNIPVLSLETDYTDTDAEQLRTRIGAFVEMLSK